MNLTRLGTLQSCILFLICILATNFIPAPPTSVYVAVIFYALVQEHSKEA